MKRVYVTVLKRANGEVIRNRVALDCMAERVRYEVEKFVEESARMEGIPISAVTYRID